MGDQAVNTTDSSQDRSAFIAHLLKDIKALERMLEEGLIESDITRIGAEQEFCLVTDNWRPSIKYQEILDAVTDEHFTTEIARFNLEINLDPIELKEGCFSEMLRDLKALLQKAIDGAETVNDRIVLSGILPTISKKELDLNHMTPSPRYKALNDRMKDLRGSDFELYIRGVDELSIRHDSVLFEACNTSFQMHLQIHPDDFVASYNWAQAIAGPLLGVCTNSPLLLGRELWAETRIALFQQSIDTRSSSYALKDQQARVTFGNSWASGTAADVFKYDIAKYKVILSQQIETDSLKELDEGRIPKLKALNLHNGTVYRWNRACYGVGGGKPHLRIENRYIPAGPTTLDEMANFVFWVGLMVGRPPEFDDMAKAMDFRDAKANFFKAARTGKESVMKWKGELISVRELVVDVMLPIARAGLKKVAIAKDDVQLFLSIIEKRAHSFTGSQWQLASYRNLKRSLRTDDALLSLTKTIYGYQRKGLPVHEWPLADPDIETHEAAELVEHIMNTQLFTVMENDLAELATSVMAWQNIHHVPVEDRQGRLKGIITWTHMKRFRESGGNAENALVSEIMNPTVISVTPETSIERCIKVMKKYEIGCVPVVQDDLLVGIITIEDVLAFDNAEN